MIVLITGGAGFIGSHVADAYTKDGHAVHVIDNFATGSRENVNNEVTLHEVDICDYEAVSAVFIAAQPQLVIHAAAQASIPRSVEDPAYDQAVNVVGTQNVVAAAVACGSVQRFLNISTAGVLYGDAASRPTRETAVPVISNPYVEHKLEAEAIVARVTNFSTVTARLSNVYGPRQNPKTEAGVIGIFIEALSSGKVPRIHGDGLQTRDFIFVSDVVTALQLLAASSEKGVFHISSGIETSIQDVYAVVSKACNVPVTPVYGPAKDHEQRFSCIDSTKLQEKLGWKPRSAFEVGVQVTIAALRAGLKNSID